MPPQQHHQPGDAARRGGCSFHEADMCWNLCTCAMLLSSKSLKWHEDMLWAIIVLGLPCPLVVHESSNIDNSFILRVGSMTPWTAHTLQNTHLPSFFPTKSDNPLRQWPQIFGANGNAFKIQVQNYFWFIVGERFSGKDFAQHQHVPKLKPTWKSEFVLV